MTLGFLSKLSNAKLRALSGGYPKCPRCKNEIVDDGTNRHKIGSELVCEDCYYEALGELIEKHPIGLPR